MRDTGFVIHDSEFVILDLRYGMHGGILTPCFSKVIEGSAKYWKALLTAYKSLIDCRFTLINQVVNNYSLGI